jgi:hypothetical protein
MLSYVIEDIFELNNLKNLGLAYAISPIYLSQGKTTSSLEPPSCGCNQKVVYTTLMTSWGWMKQAYAQKSGGKEFGWLLVSQQPSWWLVWIFFYTFLKNFSGLHQKNYNYTDNLKMLEELPGLHGSPNIRNRFILMSLERQLASACISTVMQMPATKRTLVQGLRMAKTTQCTDHHIHNVQQAWLQYPTDSFITQ